MNSAPPDGVFSPRWFPLRELTDEDNVAVTYLLSLTADNSQRTMRQSLTVLSNYLTQRRVDGRCFPWELLRHQHTHDIRTWLGRRTRLPANTPGRLRESTAETYLCALRGVLRQAWKSGLMPAEDYCRAIDLERFTRRHVEPPGRVLTVKEIRAVAHQCRKDGGPAGARDAMILGLAVSGGLGLHDMARLAVEDLSLDTGQVRLRDAGATGWRVVEVDPGTVAAATEWLRYRGRLPGPLLYAVTSGGRVRVSPLTAAAIGKRLVLRATWAKVQGFSVRDTRKTFLAGLFAVGRDIRDIQIMAGHTLLSSTARYDITHCRGIYAAPQSLPWWSASGGVVAQGVDELGLRRTRRRA